MAWGEGKSSLSFFISAKSQGLGGGEGEGERQEIRKKSKFKSKGTSKIQNGLPSSSTELPPPSSLPSSFRSGHEAMCSFSGQLCALPPPTKFKVLSRPNSRALSSSPHPSLVRTSLPSTSTQTSTPLSMAGVVWRISPHRAGLPAPGQGARGYQEGKEAGREGARGERQGGEGERVAEMGSPEKEEEGERGGTSQPASLIGLDTVPGQPGTRA